MESNDPSVSLDLIMKGLVSLGVTLPELGRILIEKKPGVDIRTQGSVIEAKKVRDHRAGHLNWKHGKPVGAYATAKVAVVRASKKR
jgi:hypothetical protein